MSTVRVAATADVPAVTSIYNAGIRSRRATFETTERTPARVLRRIGDFSVYVAEHARGQRIGDALLAAFLPACAQAGLWKLVSRLFLDNGASRALCARHGFREVGTYEKHAQLDGVWRDVLIVERLLPATITPT